MTTPATTDDIRLLIDAMASCAGLGVMILTAIQVKDGQRRAHAKEREATERKAREEREEALRTQVANIQAAVTDSRNGSKLDKLSEDVAGLRGEVAKHAEALREHCKEDQKVFGDQKEAYAKGLGELKEQLTRIATNQENDRGWLKSLADEVKRRRA